MECPSRDPQAGRAGHFLGPGTSSKRERVRPAILSITHNSTALAETANPVPGTFARVVPGNVSPTSLGVADRVFVTDAARLRGLNAVQIAEQLEIPASSSFKIIEFSSEGIAGIATPIRNPSPGQNGDIQLCHCRRGWAEITHGICPWEPGPSD